MAIIVHKLRQHITNEVPKIFDAVFECTLDMINKNFEDFPQHRLSFYELLQAVNAHCFKAFLNIPPAQFKLVFDSVVWAFKHTMRNVADMGLNILFKVHSLIKLAYRFLFINGYFQFQMLQNLDQHPGAAQSFYQTYFTDILMQIFSVVTDTSHTAGLPNHAIILAYMFSLVENRKITVNLGPIPDNMIFIQEYVASLLKSAFTHLSDNQVKVFVTGLFNLDENVQAFKEHLRDFLIQIRVSIYQMMAIKAGQLLVNIIYLNVYKLNCRRPPARTIPICTWKSVKRLWPRSSQINIRCSVIFQEC